MTVLPESADVVLPSPLRAVAAANVDLAPAPRPTPEFVPVPAPAPRAAGQPRVVLVTEGTYPHAHGGVSVWCDQLVQGLPEVPFSVVALVAFGYQQPVWDLPDHVVSLDTVGLWSPRRARPESECDDDPDGPAARLAALLVAGQDDVEGFRAFLDHVATLRVDAIGDALAFGPLLAALDRELHRPRGGTLADVRAADLVEVAEMLDHLLRPLAADPGPAPVYHASSNGLAALVCMAARRRHGGRFLLTEHGIYLRERYLELRRTPMSRAAKALLVRFHRLVSAAAYAEAAVIAPGSEWNQRWESRYGAPGSRMRTIYNGIDPSEFPDRDAEPSGAVVSWLGRVDPIKDLDTLIRAFATVHAARPDAELRLYGRTPAGNEDYRAELDDLIAELGLEGVVTFPGGVPASADAYTDAQVAVLSSISEGFPYSLIEAMACGLPAVATGVGGVPEAVADAGIVVPPRAPELLGEAIVRLLDDPEGRARMGARARERVVGLFTLAHCLTGYRALYDELDTPVDRTGPIRLRLAASRKRGGDPVVDAGGAADADPLDTGQQAKVVAAVGGAEAMAVAVDAEEVAATLESVGVTDQVAADSFAAPDVFRLAERAWHKARIDAARLGAAVVAPAPPPRAAPTSARDALGRGLAYVLPAVVVAAATAAGAPQATLVVASLLGWGLSQGGGVLAYTALHRTVHPDDLGPLRRWLVVVVTAVAAAGIGVGVAGGPADGVAFALPLLHLVGSTALVMAGRSRLLVAALLPVSAVSAAGLAVPGTGLVRWAAPTAMVTVAGTLAVVAWLARGGSPAGKAARDLLEPVDRWRAVPLVLAGWVTAAFALLAVAAASHLPAFRGADARHWLLVALPLWGLVAGCEFVLLGLHRSLRALLRATATVAAYRRAARWTVTLWLGGAVAGLQGVALAAALSARALGLPGYGALTAAGIFLLVAVALLAVTVLTTAGRSGAAGAGIGLAALLLGLLAASPSEIGGVGDHVAALAITSGTAIALLLSAARSLIDPASHR
jgi:polysaccharide biosynthesis protein PelF